MRTLLLALIALIALSYFAFAKEPMVYTDQDLEKYTYGQTYEQETIDRGEADLRNWEKETTEKRESEKKELENKQAVKDGQSVTEEMKPAQEPAKEPVKSTQQIKKKRT